MRLLTKALREQIPALYSTEDEEDPLLYVKLFTPDSSWTWYIAEWDGSDICFGLAAGHYVELGYFSLRELESVRGPWGLPVERDTGFKPTQLSVVKRQGKHLCK